MVSEENTLVREDSAGNESRFGTDLEPCKCPFVVEKDGCRVRVRVVGADLLDETSVAWCATVSHNNVEECEILLSVALESDFYSHCESVFKLL